MRFIVLNIFTSSFRNLKALNFLCFHFCLHGSRFADNCSDLPTKVPFSGGKMIPIASLCFIFVLKSPSVRAHKQTKLVVRTDVRANSHNVINLFIGYFIYYLFSFFIYLFIGYFIFLCLPLIVPIMLVRFTSLMYTIFSEALLYAKYSGKDM